MAHTVDIGCERFQTEYLFQQDDLYLEFLQQNFRKHLCHSLSHLQQLVIH